MRWFWLWRLRVANRRLREALDDLPFNWNEDPVKHVKEIIEWAQAHTRVSELLNKIDKKSA